MGWAEAAMTPTFECGDAVRVVRALRNDGTFAGRARGELLVRRGSVGYVREWGYSCRIKLSIRCIFSIGI